MIRSNDVEIDLATAVDERKHSLESPNGRAGYFGCSFFNRALIVIYEGSPHTAVGIMGKWVAVAEVPDEIELNSSVHNQRVLGQKLFPHASSRQFERTCWHVQFAAANDFDDDAAFDDAEREGVGV